MTSLPRAFFDADAAMVARGLIGMLVKKGGCEGVIVETEAYADDPASHAIKKPVQGRLMRETTGRWYVYFTYGMHWCANVTCDKHGTGAVLIRAVEPVKGIATMKRRRGIQDTRTLAAGPARFTQAFGIGKSDNGKPLSHSFGIFLPDTDSGMPQILTGPRIGIRKGTELPWRFFLKDNPFVSKQI